MPMRSNHGAGRWLTGYLGRWSGLSLLSRILLALSALSSLAVAVILTFVLYLFIGGFSGGNGPTSVAPVLFPIAFLLLIVAGLPSMVVCGLLWVGYAASRRRRAQPGEPARRRRSAG